MSHIFPAEAESDYKPFSNNTTGEPEVGAGQSEPNCELSPGNAAPRLIRPGHETQHDPTSQQQVVGGVQSTTTEGWAAKATYFVNQGSKREVTNANEIEELKKTIASLKQKEGYYQVEQIVQDQKAELADCKKELAEKERELNLLQASLKAEVQAVEDKLQKERADHKRKIEKVEEEVKSLQCQLKEKTSEAENLRHEYDDLKKTTQATIRELKEKLIAKTKEATQLKDQYQRLEEKRKDEIAQLDKKYQQKISELKELVESQKEQARLKEQNLEMKLEKDYMGKEFQRLKDETDLKLKIKDLEMELAQKEVKLAQKETQVEQMQKEEQARQHKEVTAKMEKEKAKVEEEKAKVEQQMKLERSQSERRFQEMVDSYEKQIQQLCFEPSTNSNEVSISRNNTVTGVAGTSGSDTNGAGTDHNKDNISTVTKVAHLSISHHNDED